ncbi:AlpA family transcriptional regulator [Paracoccus sp. SCSIO 75233]|uniref:helix-turn-helix transcriptional regulator n=1 Tax=Paracoccus sp. SCSIO 75233 TaxID=3017782 RepID=UPI0022F07D77|nr:AlpA family transcriptional regulator [Paracoccus sp. SCSIO 75233]WBU52067.1 AlpA family transcriptional regulator [Paracoccus sp. SCSIO 75233]
MLEGSTLAHRIYRRPEVEKITGLSRSTLYRLMAEGNFPKPIKLTGKAVGWTDAAIDDWLDSREQAAA